MRAIQYIDVDETLLASHGQRLGNYFIDIIMQYIIMFFIGIFASLLYLAFEIDTLVIWVENMTTLQALLLTITIHIIYFGLMETLFSRTVSKWITGTKVVLQDGSTPDASTILLRTFCRLIPFEHFSFLGGTARGWHDSLSSTYVIDVKKYNAALALRNSLNEIGNTDN